MKRNKGITKLQPKKYRVRAVGTNPRTGRRKVITRVCNGSLKDAQRLYVELKQQIESGDVRERMTLGDYAKSWMTTKAPRLKRSTRSKYVTDLRLHILPEFGEVFIDTIRPMDIKQFIAKQSERLAGNTVKNQLAVLRQLAKDALADEYTTRDFCARVAAPRCHRYTEEDPNLLTAGELDRLMGAVPPQWYPHFAALAFTGLRWGEVAALCWTDIDEDNQLIRVRRNNWKGRISAPKTRASIRSTALRPELAAALAQHQVWMQRVDHPGKDSELIFTSRRHGGPYKGTPLNKVIKQAMADARIDKRLTPHGLRRTFNDLVRRVAEGRVVRSMIGHSSNVMTDHYSMIDAGEKHAAAEAALSMVKQQAKVRRESQRLACLVMANLLQPFADATVQRGALLEWE